MVIDLTREKYISKGIPAKNFERTILIGGIEMQNKRVVILLLLILALFTYSVGAMGAESKEVTKKKFLFIKDDDSDFFNGFAKFIEGQVRAKGYTPDKVEYKVMSMKGKGENGKNF